MLAESEAEEKKCTYTYFAGTGLLFGELFAYPDIGVHRDVRERDTP